MSVKDNMDLEEEIALLKKENEELKIDMINHTTQNYSEWKKEQETLAIGLVREDLKRAEEENKKLKKENEELNKKKSIKWSREYATPRIKQLEKENEELKFKNHKLEFQLSNPTFDDDYANEIIGDRNEEINKLKKENEELKDGENTAKMIDKLNDEFSVLQDKNIKLEEENKENIEAKVKLYKEFLKIQEEMDLLYDYTDYPEDMINPDYSKADGIEEWMCAREDELCDFQSETSNLEEKNKELKKEIEKLKKQNENLGTNYERHIKSLEEENEKLKKENEEFKADNVCMEGVLNSVENILRSFGDGNKLPEEDLECKGCRIRQIGDFVVFMIKGIQNDKFPVVEATPVN